LKNTEGSTFQYKQMNGSVQTKERFSTGRGKCQNIRIPPCRYLQSNHAYEV